MDVPPLSGVQIKCYKGYKVIDACLGYHQDQNAPLRPPIFYYLVHCMDNNSVDHAGAGTGVVPDSLVFFYLIPFVGFVIATTLYGVTLLQGLYYFRTYTKDSWSVKLLTLVLLALDTATTVLQAQSIYFYQIQNFGNYASAAYEPLTLRVESSIPALTILLVQSFYVNQIWKLSKNKYFVIVLEIITLASFGLALEVFVDLVGNASTANSISKRTLVVSSITQALYTFSDIMITGSLCWLLHSRRVGIKRTEKLVDRLIILAIDRGLVTAVAQLCYLILDAPFPGKIYWFPIHQTLAKLYTNSYLGMLNVRGYSKTIGGQVITIDDTITSLRFADRGLVTADLRSSVRPSSRFESHDPESFTDMGIPPSKTEQSGDQSVFTEDVEQITSVPPQAVQRNRITGRDVSSVDLS